MATLNEIRTLSVVEAGKVSSLITLMSSVRKLLQDLLISGTLTPADQTKVDEIFTNLTTNIANVQVELDTPVPTVPPRV